MDQIGIRELRGDLSSIVRLAGEGSEVLITVDGLPVAQLGPPRAPSSPPSIEQLMVTGRLIGPRRAPESGPTVTVQLSTGEQINRLIREIRGR